MANINTVTGVGRVIGNLNRKHVQLGLGIQRGLKKAGLHLQRESQKLVPVRTGNLKNSAFTRADGASFDTVVTVGYTASYAMFVHENVEMKLQGQKRPPDPNQPGARTGRFWDPQGRAQAKFLEQPAREKRNKLRQIINRSAGISIV